uniref:Peptidase M20 domain-containing protein 2 n=1 Tax=Saccoglossus kowalevskii TaxID=10224 RepID=A0ABM0GMK5_SACKO|nr:PREDICTED: peptidase M20 domain-containing protein 2-like [Saccoglossus kowalevskii]
MTDMENMKKTAANAIDAASKDLHELSMDIWNNPELNFEEHHAHKVLTNFLDKTGFQVQRHYKLDTAFRATYDTGNTDGFNVCLISEYDALPDIGHACGHNLIAEVGVGAGLGAKAALEAGGHKVGKLIVLGTPAEEGGGGKINLIEAGAFKDIDVAMMAHPTDRQNNIPTPKQMAMIQMDITYTGKASHAAYAPWEGINALDAAVMFYQNMSVMRQQLKPTWRTHGIISNGGAKPNIISEKSELVYYLRTPSNAELPALQEKAIQCAKGAAQATGCNVEYSFSQHYANVIHNATLIDYYRKNAESLGMKLFTPEQCDKASAGSTDMGNVTHVVPGFHPKFGIGSEATTHSRGFTVTTGTPEAQIPTLTQAKVLAMTALDVFFQDGAMDKIQADFKKDIEKEEMMKVKL